MSKVYCRAPWVSACYMPNGKFTPCCAWGGNHFDSQQDIIDHLGEMFKENRAPEQCQAACPKDGFGWRNRYNYFPVDFNNPQIYYLDFRNSNLCNMACRSCGPIFSSSWANELKQPEVLLQEEVDFKKLDLSKCQRVYFAGGEPLLNWQHYELLQHLIDKKIDPILLYSTNMSCLQYKQQSVLDYWDKFTRVNVNISLDAVGPYAEFVRSGTVWQDVHNNIEQIVNKPNISVSFSPVVSAISIWWITELMEYIGKYITEPTQFQPVLSSDTTAITIIPTKYRGKIIESLKNAPLFHENIKQAITLLETVDQSDLWLKFVTKQLAMDSVRGEQWFNHLPIRDELYKFLVYEL